MVGVGRLPTVLAAILFNSSSSETIGVCCWLYRGSTGKLQLRLRGTFGGLVEGQRKNYRVHKVKKYWLLNLSRTLVTVFRISRFKWDWGRSRLQTGAVSYCLRFVD